MAFVVFNRKVQNGGSPAVTFTTNGRLAFNKAATAKFEKHDVEYVLLLWDAEGKRIGVQPIPKKLPILYSALWEKWEWMRFFRITYRIWLDIILKKLILYLRYGMKLKRCLWSMYRQNILKKIALMLIMQNLKGSDILTKEITNMLPPDIKE